MKVIFKRTGERRYSVFVERDSAPEMMMHPAPGYDPFLPHDLLHFVAEAEWGLDGAVFGQNWKERLDQARVEPEQLEAVLVSLDDLAGRWHGLRIGEALMLDWPRPEGRRPRRNAISGRRAPPG
jgi:hypothetical protein